jgi:ATP-dependent Clp protease ATP-binding subunit ClpC
MRSVRRRQLEFSATEVLVNGYNFTEAVRHTLQAAREEAIALGHEYVGTEHILLGLLQTKHDIPAVVFRAQAIDPSSIRHGLLALLKPGISGRRIGPDLPYTSRAKKVLEEALTEARELGHSYVGAEHLLLGLYRERKGLAAQSLLAQGLTEAIARQEIVRILGAESSPDGRAPLSSEQPPKAAIPSSFLIVIEDTDGQQGVRPFTQVQDAIDYLNQWRGRS